MQRDELGSKTRTARRSTTAERVELAERAGVSSATIKKYEAQTGIPNANTRILSAVKSVLESAGIEFTGDPLVNPGVTLRIKRDD